MLSPREFIEILRLRLVLEVAAARQAVPLLSSSQWTLERIQTEMYGPVPLDLGTFLSLNREFHFILYTAADNARQLRFIETLWLQIGPLLRLVSNETEGRTGLEPHGAMVQAARRAMPQACRRNVPRYRGSSRRHSGLAARPERRKLTVGPAARLAPAEAETLTA